MKKAAFVLLAFLTALPFSRRSAAFTAPGPGESFVYPSPASGNYVYLAFSMANPGQTHLLVYNEAGSLVMDDLENFPKGVQKIRINNFLFAPGVYVYRLYIDYVSGSSEKISGKFAAIH